LKNLAKKKAPPQIQRLEAGLKVEKLGEKKSPTSNPKTWSRAEKRLKFCEKKAPPQIRRLEAGLTVLTKYW